MKNLLLAAHRAAVLLLLAPLACGADGLLRGAMPVGRPSLDPPGVQVIPLPSGALVKRMPGQAWPGDAAATPAARAAPVPAGVSVQQSGSAQMQVLAGGPAVVPTARPAGLAVRQAGGALLLEVAGQRSPAPAAAVAVLPAGVRVVDLSPSEPLPVNPQPHTLYRRQP